MKFGVITAAMAITAFASIANAQTTIIEERRPAVVVAPPPAVVIEQPTTSTTVERNSVGIGGILGTETRSTTTTTGAGIDCQRQTTTQNSLLGSSSVTTNTCN